MMTEMLQIKQMADTASLQNGCRTYDIYKHRDRLQVLIDKKSDILNLNDCENVFHSLQFLLHSQLPHILENYRLEVSSPGIEKRLREKWHFEESIGKTIKLNTTSAVEIKNIKKNTRFFSRSLVANLVSISDDHLHLKNQLIKCNVAFTDIKSAKLVFKELFLKQSPKKLKPNKKKN